VTDHHVHTTKLLVTSDRCQDEGDESVSDDGEDEDDGEDRDLDLSEVLVAFERLAGGRAVDAGGRDDGVFGGGDCTWEEGVRGRRGRRIGV